MDGIALVGHAAMGEVFWLGADLLADASVSAAFASLFGSDGRPLATHGAKALMRALLEVGIDLRSLVLDTSLAAYLLDPAESRYLLDDLLGRYVHKRLPDAVAVPDGQLDFGTESEGSTASASLDAARRALAVDALVDPLLAALDAQGLRHLHDDIEVPLVRVLARMEVVGIGVDVDRLRSLNEQMGAECESLTALIWADAGEEFNVNSTPQLRRVLFEKLGLAPQKKTKTGFSTDAASLEKLVGEHPIIDHLLRYREVEKLRSTYGEGLLSAVGPDGRIHATFQQTVARTGRLSSDAPNLHNIPVRSEIGRAFRTAFVPAEGYELLVADYNQIELRCIAHLAEDPGLIAAFEAGTDIHTETAARVFGVALGEVTPEQRAKAKMVSYGLAYGMEAYGLAQRLSISTPEAQEILDAYFVAFPAVRSYMERTVAEARERGYTETLFGRRRQIPELSSSNFRIRQAGERQAMNAGIQGLAADIFKVALVRLDRELEEADLGSRLILQVHDEVILEVPPAHHRRGGGRHPRGHVRRLRPAGPAGREPLVGAQLGRRQELIAARMPNRLRVLGADAGGTGPCTGTPGWCPTIGGVTHVRSGPTNRPPARAAVTYLDRPDGGMKHADELAQHPVLLGDAGVAAGSALPGGRVRVDGGQVRRGLAQQAVGVGASRLGVHRAEREVLTRPLRPRRGPERRRG